MLWGLNRAERLPCFSNIFIPFIFTFWVNWVMRHWYQQLSGHSMIGGTTTTTIISKYLFIGWYPPPRKKLNFDFICIARSFYLFRKCNTEIWYVIMILRHKGVVDLEDILDGSKLKGVWVKQSEQKEDISYGNFKLISFLIKNCHTLKQS